MDSAGHPSGGGPRFRSARESAICHRSHLFALAGLFLVVGLAGCRARDADNAPADAAARSDAAAVSTEGAPAVGAVSGSDALALDDLERTVEILHEKFTALAAAMPQEDLGWRPMEGVRSVEEVFVHVAADNWWVPAMMGWEAPPETKVTEDPATFTAYQARTMSREEMLDALDASFVFFREAMAESAGALDRSVSLRGTPAVVGDIWIRATVHLHEHLGQSIAYARANEVVPPWSR